VCDIYVGDRGHVLKGSYRTMAETRFKQHSLRCFSIETLGSAPFKNHKQLFACKAAHRNTLSLRSTELNSVFPKCLASQMREALRL